MSDFSFVYSILIPVFIFFFFNDTATTEIYTLSLHDALPISDGATGAYLTYQTDGNINNSLDGPSNLQNVIVQIDSRSEEHTSELQSQFHLVCRLLLEKKKKNKNKHITNYQ